MIRWVRETFYPQVTVFCLLHVVLFLTWFSAPFFAPTSSQPTCGLASHGAAMPTRYVVNVDNAPTTHVGNPATFIGRSVAKGILSLS